MSEEKEKLKEQYTEENHTCSYEEFLEEELVLSKYYLECCQEFSDDLELLIHQIHKSGVLKGTEFEKTINAVVKTLDI